MYEDLFVNDKYLKLKTKEIVEILINADKYYHLEGYKRPLLRHEILKVS